MAAIVNCYLPRSCGHANVCSHLAFTAADGDGLRADAAPFATRGAAYADATEPVTLLGDRTRTTTLSWGAVPASYSPVEDAFGGV